MLAAVLHLAAAEPPDSPVADAAMRDDPQAVRALIARGADVNAPHGDGMTALHWAAANSNPEIARMLISAGANVHAGTRIGGYTPLHLAARAGSAAVVTTLLDAAADPGVASTNSGAAPLHLAAASGSAAAVAALLDHGADPNARERAWGQTPLIFAAANNRVEAIRVLIDRGADPRLATDVVDVPERAAIDAMAEERLVESLADFREKAGRNDGSWQPTATEMQAAIEAARAVQLNPRVVEEYEEEVAEEEMVGYPVLVGTWGGLTPLHHAVRDGHVESAMALLDLGADVNQVNAGDRTSPLLLATINGHFDLALLLIDRGADPNLTSAAGATPLYTALNTQWAPRTRNPQPTAYRRQQATYLDVMKALLDAGADPNARLTKHLWYMSYTFDLLRVDTRGATPFWRAAYATDLQAMRMLVEYGADPDIPTRKPPDRRRSYEAEQERVDPSGLPPVPVGGPAVWPIHAASGVGYGEGYAANAHRHVPDGWLPAVTYLVEALGADVNVRDHNGYNALHHAAARGDNELILYLVEKGADVTAVSRRGQTTADMANGPVQRISPYPATIDLLESLGSKNNNNCLSC